MARIKRYTEGPGGWTKWLTPVMEGYRLICCDCGLSHSMEFKVIKVLEDHGDTFTFEDVDGEEFRIAFRARRNNRSTAAIRRRKAKPPRDH